MVKAIYCLLIKKPWIGSISAVSSGYIGSIHESLTNENALKFGSALAVWLGILIGGLTAIAKGIEIYAKFKSINNKP